MSTPNVATEERHDHSQGWSPAIRLACPRGSVSGSHPLAHDMTTRDAQDIVYALTAAYGDEATERDPESRPHADGSLADDLMPCPLEVLRWAREPEMYAEHVEGCREQARNANGDHR